MKKNFLLIFLITIAISGSVLITINAEPDTDNDGIVDSLDNCPSNQNPSQFDLDSDGLGNACDVDVDNDSVNNQIDNCAIIPNNNQLDMDGDGIGDVCDAFIAIGNNPLEIKKFSPSSFNPSIVASTTVNQGNSLGNINSQNCMSGSCSINNSMNFGTGSVSNQQIFIRSVFDFNVSGITNSQIKELTFTLNGCWHGGNGNKCNDSDNPDFATNGRLLFAIWNGTGYEQFGTLRLLGTSTNSSFDKYTSINSTKFANYGGNYVNDGKVRIAIQTNGNTITDAKVQQVIDNVSLDVKYYNSSVVPDKPNILVVMTDDQRWDTTYFMPYVTQLASEGITFENAFVNTPLCCPARSSFLTGVYAHDHHVWTNHTPNGGATVFNDTSTLATWLNSTGYSTSLIGKYMNDYFPLHGYVPPGWDDWHGMAPATSYFYKFTDNGVISPKAGNSTAEYSTDVLKNKAIDFIQTAERPFFLLLAPNAPHIDPNQYATVAPRHQGTCDNLPEFRPASYNEADVSDKPIWVQNLPPLENNALNNLGISGIDYIDNLRESQLCSLKAVDEMMSDIVAKLGPEADNTVIVFTSDNGYSWGEHRWYYKTCEYDECIRVPLVIRYPPLITPNSTSDSIVQLIDLTSTIVELSESTPTTPLKGSSLTPIFSDPTIAINEAILLEQEIDETCCYYVDQFAGVRTPDYKYIQNEITGSVQLYNLTSDPFELENKIADPSYSDVITQLQTMLAQLRIE